MLNALLSMVAKLSRLGHPIFDMGFNVSPPSSHPNFFECLTYFPPHKLCYFGLPAAGILSAELLRRSRCIVSDIHTHFPRSEIIQSLSIFASHLDTFIQSHEGNYRVSQPGRRVIRHILDQVLSHDNSPVVVSDASETMEQDLLVGNILHEVDADDRDLFLDWMDGAVEHKSDSWLRWVNFS